MIFAPVLIGCGDTSKQLSKTENTNSSFKTEEKINGVSFVASPLILEQKYIDPIVAINANYATIMPFGFIKNLEHPELVYNSDRQWFGETLEGASQYIQLLHDSNIKVMLKPQIWIWRGEYTGRLKMTNEENWKLLEASYKNFIGDYAQLAEEKNVEIFCIGTELEDFLALRPQFWNELIEYIKTIYKGKLTYAANWDEYKRVPFWKQLDYIGIDAYFPITEEKSPALATSLKGWQSWKQEMKEISTRESKQILFTEYGYRSVDFAGKTPWEASREMPGYNTNAQEVLLKSLYVEVWKEPWFAGGFLWKWFVDHDKMNITEDTQFSPQNKPAEEVVKQYYLKTD